jgi:hypothetical protein
MVNGYFTLPVADLAEYGLMHIQVPGGEATSTTPSVASGGRETSIEKSNFGSSVASVKAPSNSIASTARNARGAQPITTTVKVNAQTGAKQLDMVNGTAFIAHHDPVAVNIPGGLVKIASGSAAYISRHGNATAIFNLDDQGSIVVSAGEKDRTVPAGQALIVCTDQSADFGAINPCRKIIDPTSVKLLESSSAARTFTAPYSPLAVLDDSAQFAQLAKSNQPSDRVLTNRILKTAAALSQMSP